MILGINYDFWHLILALIAFVGFVYMFKGLYHAFTSTVALQALNELYQAMFTLDQYASPLAFVVNSIQDWLYAGIGIGAGVVIIAILTAFNLTPLKKAGG